MNAYKILLASCAIFATALPAQAELNLWQQNFVGCSVSSSPYTTQVLFKDAAKVRPLMQISGMNAWAVPTADGGQQIALTTPDGLTIYGRIVGPQGEDISAALLATRPTVTPEPSPFDPQSPVTTSTTSTQAPANITRTVPGDGAAAQIAASPTVQAAPPTAQPSPAPAQEQAAPVKKPADTQAADSATESKQAQAPVIQPTQPAPAAGSTPPLVGAQPQQQAQAANPPQQMASIGSQTVPDVPKAASIDQLMQQAQDFAMWFPANKPKPGSPLVYVFVDPTCPHCAWSFEHLKPRIDDSTIDLRIIMAPILSAEAAQIAASIMHQEDIPTTLRDQLASVIGSGKPAPKVDPKNFDKAVVAAMQRNVDWMRLNGVPGTPFYLYRTKEGAQFAFGALNDAQLGTALPDAQPAATANNAGAAAQ
ncbi:thioredoxin fold domain-containing protein (plasmid) [Aminobacter sp. SR38]|uniref:thioredoxin fold domain-containing protein n=1 Tax=Aminobacter sp. SR38 TaxID=2774562 RepID=UPI00177FF86D|nr:thioredoxin fold domain-containing protein [Aminobacter sp. SR38]QOF75201.1 thioredoxin fold domain-containing protein [Aminobacter sp. SR38]